MERRKEVRFYNRKMETLPREELRALQFQKVKRLLEKVYYGNKFFRQHLDRAKVKPEDIKSLDDFINRVPFLTKQDLLKDQEENPPYGNRLCVPEEMVKQIHLTSGTSGMGQEVYCLTEADMTWGAEGFVYHFYAAGLTEGDISAHLWPIATMPGGLIALEALRLIRANPMLLHLFDSQTKLKMMKRFSPHHIFATPVYLTRLSHLCQEMGIEPKKDLPRLKGITLSTGPFPAHWAQKMEDFWGSTIHDVYGSSQIGTACAYSCHKGVIPEGKPGCYHLLEHMVLMEVLDRSTGRLVKYGEEGEPVFTTFDREASPLIRFKSNDRARLLPPETCDCSRTSDTWEMGTISRYDDMIKMKATNVWPSSVDDVIFSHEEADEYNGRVFIDDQGKERVEILLEFKKDVKNPELKRKTLEKIIRELKERTQVTMEVREVPYGTIERFEYKAIRWVDERMKGLERVKFVEK